MTCYPVYIPTLNRYEHFRNCVESLARCTHADKTELVVSLDYPPSEKYVEGWKKIKDYLPTLQTLGFGKVTVFEQTENLGAYENATYLWNYCAAHYDACVVSEDDNVFAPAFLDFVDKALALYASDEKIVSVCGYSQTSACKRQTYLSEDCCAWGMGLWIEKHRKVFGECLTPGWGKKFLRSFGVSVRFALTYPIGFVMFFKMVKTGAQYGDLSRTAYNFLHRTYQLRPGMSLVRNCGQDGSGVSCSSNSAASQQRISEATTFDFDTKPPRVSHKGLFWQGWETTRFAMFMSWVRKCLGLRELAERVAL